MKILIIKPKFTMKANDLLIMRNTILREVKSGVVLIPPMCDYEVADFGGETVGIENVEIRSVNADD